MKKKVAQEVLAELRKEKIRIIPKKEGSMFLKIVSITYDKSLEKFLEKVEEIVTDSIERKLNHLRQEVAKPPTKKYKKHWYPLMKALTKYEQIEEDIINDIRGKLLLEFRW